MPRENELETHSGLYVDVFDTDPETIALEDIAVHLACEPRYMGATRRTLSVAEHSLRASFMVERQFGGSTADAYAALMHDASEAYLRDWPRPLKTHPELGPLYRKVEDRLMSVIAARFGFEWPKPPKVSLVDEALGWLEADALMPSRGKTWDNYESCGAWVVDLYAATNDVSEEFPAGLAGLPEHINHMPMSMAKMFVGRARALCYQVTGHDVPTPRSEVVTDGHRATGEITQYVGGTEFLA